ncbi:NAD dependent epimerase/dehydratase family [Aspergillus sclerotialis]|uniref:NAD dependent epimerase/dehydratase family n=1 Tax=Aspergillus sclerotialis TaxID=2070753 RepID=A0A3A2ZJ53_9EURO|nr:NAD dependent epimerase/dehydratase family [Aspergillus sclerotialis]
MGSVAVTTAEQYDIAVRRNRGLGQLFYDEVQRRPASIAVIDDHTSLTYEELHTQACQIAERLSQEAVGVEEPVGILVQHGIADVVAQMAIIYAGGSCVPIDPTLPEQQIQRRLERLSSRLILVDQANTKRQLPFTLIALEQPSSLNTEELCITGQYPVTTDLSHRTHLIHTSGTTSEPKAVQIVACSILEVVFHAPFEPVHTDDVVAHVNNTSFDVALFDIWVPLLRGARITIVSKTILLDLPSLAKQIDRHGITVMATTTALLNLAASTYTRAFANLRICFIGGEAANLAAVETILNEGPPDMLINAYGPTECCIFCLAHRVTQRDLQTGSISIGTPIGRTVAYIANEAGEADDEGELWIGGPGVSPGYVNLPDKNEASFTKVEGLTTASGDPIRFYRTGDIVRRRPDGQIDYVGRRDHQVKVRGYRIELGAVEAGLLKTGQFAEAVAMRIEAPQEGAGSILVAYATPADPSNPPTIPEALDMLKKILPGYMIPQLELISTMPLNSHVKVDRKRLVDLFYQKREFQLLQGPSDPLVKDTRSTLASLWAKILASPLPSYQDDDDFFLLGGTSLQASLLISQIRQAFGTEVSLLTLYDNSSLGALADIIDQYRGGQFETVRNDCDLWLADTKLADDLPTPVGSPVDWRRDTEGRVFLTGATGFVGAFLLADLLRMPEVHQVGCLVRAKDAVAGMERLRAAMAKYDLWNDQFTHKLLAFPGVLEDKYLGQEQARFNELANWASVVFHLGARVNYVQPYSLHRPANTLGTVNVVRFACHGRTKTVHYISSISCFGPTGFVTGAKIVEEDESLLPHIEALPYDHGYAQSQWVAEQLLRRLMDRGFPIAVYRPGFITGHSQTGACNPDDFFSRLIHACRQMGCYPQLPNQRKEFVPVDYVNSVVLHIAASPAALGHAFHIVPPSRELSIDMNDSMDLIGSTTSTSTPSSIEGVPYAEWIRRLAANPPKQLQPLLPMLAEKVQDGLTRWELYENMPLYQTTNTNKALADYPGGLDFPVLGPALMQRYQNYLQTRFS